jgi:hypothetical protein
MADDPLDQLMSATLAIEGEEARHRRAALPFGDDSLSVARTRVDYLWHDAAAEQGILRDAEAEWTAASNGASGPKGEAFVRGILADGKPMSIEDITRRYEEALDRGGERLFCLAGGELTLSFEPVDALRVTLSVVTPLLGDARLKEAYDAAQEALRTGTSIAPAIALSHKQRIDEATKAALRGSLDPAESAIESVVERALLEDRAFARCRVFAGSFVRCSLGVGSSRSGSPVPVPVYLPEAGARELPLMRVAPMRLVVEVRPSQDAAEPHPLALRALALARVVELG